MKYLVVGSGFSGSVIAERIANVLDENVTVIDKRTHIGGTSYSHRDKETGIDIHDFGSHIFHTNDYSIWKYINRFGRFSQYQHHVILKTNGITTQMPINLRTIQDIFKKQELQPSQAKYIVDREITESNIQHPNNLEEKAISLIGKTLYDYCIKGYTSKQWNRDPRELPENIIRRLPTRYNYNSNYFNDKYQGIPEEGYDKLIENMLKSEKIDVRLNTSFEDIRQSITEDTLIFYSGMIDEFMNYRFGKLEWRSLEFEFERLDIDDYQGNSIINYSDINIPYTRIHEFKHYQPERSEIFNTGKTIICREYPQDWSVGKEAYYPVESSENIEKLKKYQEYANKNLKNVVFIGRLGKYRYFDMDKVIKDSLETFENLNLK